MKKLLAIILVAVLLCLAAGSVTAVTLLSIKEGDTVTEISFSVFQIDMVVGDVCALPIVLSREDGNIEVLSSNTDILKIEDGNLKAINTIGNNRSIVYVVAKNELGEKSYLNVIVYDTVDSFLANQGSGLYVAYRVYNDASDSWRLAGFNRYEKDAYVNAPIIPAQEGFDINPNWYSSEDLADSSKITFQGVQITESFVIYTQEYIRDGSERVSGHIDLNVEYNDTYNIYVVTGLVYDKLNYKEITIPKTYQIKNEEETLTVDIRGIANDAFYRGKKDGEARLNTGLQTLTKVDISYIEYIGANAFKDCLLLNEVLINKNKIVKCDATAFAGTAFDGTEYCKE